MFAKVIADRYARAVLNSCEDLHAIQRADDELTLLEETWRSSAATREFFMNPKMPPRVKVKILTDALGEELSPVVMKLLVLLVEKRRQDLIVDISIKYNQLTDKVRGVEHAHIICATDLPPDLQASLTDKVQKFSDRKVEVDFSVNPEIIGGIQIKLGDNVIDGSLSRRFEEIRRVMLAARLPRATPDQA